VDGRRKVGRTTGSQGDVALSNDEPDCLGRWDPGGEVERVRLVKTGLTRLQVRPYAVAAPRGRRRGYGIPINPSCGRACRSPLPARPSGRRNTGSWGAGLGDGKGWRRYELPAAPSFLFSLSLTFSVGPPRPSGVTACQSRDFSCQIDVRRTCRRGHQACAPSRPG